MPRIRHQTHQTHHTHHTHRPAKYPGIQLANHLAPGDIRARPGLIRSGHGGHQLWFPSPLLANSLHADPQDGIGAAGTADGIGIEERNRVVEGTLRDAFSATSRIDVRSPTSRVCFFWELIMPAIMGSPVLEVIGSWTNLLGERCRSGHHEGLVQSH